MHVLSPVEAEWPLHVQLTNGSVYGCDLVLSATGVLPCTDFITRTHGLDTMYEVGDVVCGSWILSLQPYPCDRAHPL